MYNIEDFPLIIEDFPDDYSGYKFITLLKYNNTELLTIVDNADEKIIKAFVLDLCQQEQIDEDKLINIASNWYDEQYSYPLSIELSKLGELENVKRIYKKFNINFISRVIGPLPRFEMGNIKKIKKKRKRAIYTEINS